jgi:TonB family protein
LGENFLRTTGMPPATESLLNELDRCAQDSAIQARDSVTKSPAIQPQGSATQSTVQSGKTSASQARAASAEVPIGVLEVPVGVWGSRRGAFASGQPGRIEVFAEETSTVIVFPHGAVIRMSSAVAAGQMMMLTNRESRQVAACRVVKARNYPNAKGYAEIEFFRPTNDFWGAYVPQGTLKLSPGNLPAAPDKYAEDFWSAGYSPEMINALANAPTASRVAPATVLNKAASIESRPVQIPSVKKTVQRATLPPTPTQQPQRGEVASERSWIRDFLSSLPGQAVALSAADRNYSPRPKMAFAWVTVTCLLIMVGATGLYLRQRGAVQSDATAQTDSTPGASAVSSTANAAESAQVENNSSSAAPSAAPGVPVIAKTENFPGAQAREFGDNVRTSQPSARASSLERKLLNRKPLAPPLVARRSATVLGRDLPPDVSGANSNPGAGAIPGVFAAFLPTGGSVKEPQLVSKSALNYPAMAIRARIEGEVTVDAVIDITGKLTDMKVVSGSPMLQQAALDSLRAWKYQPAFLDDKPVPVQTSITVKFRLH